MGRCLLIGNLMISYDLTGCTKMRGHWTCRIAPGTAQDMGAAPARRVLQTGRSGAPSWHEGLCSNGSREDQQHCQLPGQSQIESCCFCLCCLLCVLKRFKSSLACKYDRLSDCHENVVKKALHLEAKANHSCLRCRWPSLIWLHFPWSGRWQLSCQAQTPCSPKSLRTI